MSPLNIHAKVVDISKDNPKPSDRLLVDTNVWFWFCYQNAEINIKNHQKIYQHYIKKALLAKTQLFCSPVTFFELTHLIEKTEFDIYKLKNNIEKIKDFRQLQHERKKVIDQIEATWIQVNQIANLIPEVIVGNDLIDNTLRRMRIENLDGYDFLITESLRKEGVSCIITDDSDYVSISNIVVYTNNQRVINEAIKQNKLINRCLRN